MPEMWEQPTLALIIRDLIRCIPALACILESWLNGSASSVLTQLFPAGYSMIYEPGGGTGGRVATHFRSDLVYSKSLFQVEKKSFECIYLVQEPQLKYRNHDGLQTYKYTPSIWSSTSSQSWLMQRDLYKTVNIWVLLNPVRLYLWYL